MLQKVAFPQVFEGLLELIPGIHDNGATPGDGFVKPLGADKEDLGGGLPSRKLDRIPPRTA